MSNELELRYLINLAGNIDQRTNQYARSFASMEQRTTNSARNMQRSLRQLSDGIDRLGNRYTALATGAAGLGTARALADLERRFTRLGITADISKDQVSNLRKEIYDIASKKQIQIDANELTSAVESILEKTGDLKFAQENLENIAMTISATGAQGQAIGEIVSEFQKMGIVAPNAVRETLDILNRQGKAGAFTLENLAALGPRVVTAYTSSRNQGVQSMRELGAVLQVIRQGTGSAEMAATAFEALMRTLSDADKIKLLKGGGIKVFEDDGKTLRAINELMVEIITKAKGNKVVLSKVFDAEALRAFNAAAAEYNRTGAVGSLEKFMNVQGNGASIIKDSSTAAMDAAGSMNMLRNSWTQFADKNLTGPIQSLAKWLREMEPGKLQQYFEWLKKIAVVLGTIWAINKVARTAGGIINVARAYKTGGFAGALGSMSTGGATPVYVTNMPADGLNSTTGVNDALGYKNGKKAWDKIRDFEMPGVRGGAGMKDIWRMGPKGLAIASGYVGAAGLVGYGVGTGIYKYGMEGNRGGDAVGAGVARVLALFGNDDAQASIARMRKYDEQQQREGLLRIKIDSEGRASVKEMQSPTGTELDVGHTKGMM